jgi:serine/threonine protein kinase
MSLSEEQLDLAEEFLCEYNRKAADRRDGTGITSALLEGLKGRDLTVHSWVMRHLEEREDPRWQQRLHARNCPNCGVPARFELRKVVHPGDHRHVWVGVDREGIEPRAVAVKVFDRRIVEQDPERFDHLAGLLKGSGKHHHLARVRDAGPTADGGFYIAMDWLCGCTLTEKVSHWKAGHDRPSWMTVAKWMMDLADAADTVYREGGVVLCDLKPGNVMFSSDSGGGFPVIADLDGMVVIRDGQPAPKGSSVEGTGVYRTPEHVGGGTVGPWTAVYGLGVVLYACLTFGEEPFDEGKNEEEQQEHIRHKRPRRIETKPPPTTGDGERECFEGLLWIAEKCLRKKPGRWLPWRRYRDARRLKDDLSKLRDKGKPDAAAFRWLCPIGDFLDRNIRQWPLVGAAWLVTCVVGLLFYILMDLNTKNEAIDRDVKAYLEQTEELIEQAKKGPAEELGLWERADKPLDQALDLLSHSGARPEFDERVKLLKAEMAQGKQAAARTRRQNERNQRMRQHLMEARLATAESFDPFQGEFDYEPGDQAFSVAFREFLDEDLLKSPEPLALSARMLPNSLRPDLAAGLVEWMLTHMKAAIVKHGVLKGAWGANADCQTLRQIAAALADKNDPWEQRFHEALGSPLAALSLPRLAQEMDFKRVRASSIAILGEVIADQDSAEGVRFLKRAEADHQDDFWVNLHLAVALLQKNPPEPHEAVRYAAVAEAHANDEPAASTFLGAVFAKAGRQEEAMDRWHRTIAKRPEASYARANLVRTLVRLGDLEQAKTILSAAPEASRHHKAMLIAIEEVSRASAKH